MTKIIPDIDKCIESGINDAIHNAVQDAVDRVKAQALADVEAAIDKEVAGICLTMQKMISIESVRDEIVVTINKHSH